jgi:hypothetical protein
VQQHSPKIVYFGTGKSVTRCPVNNDRSRHALNRGSCTLTQEAACVDDDDGSAWNCGKAPHTRRSQFLHSRIAGSSRALLDVGVNLPSPHGIRATVDGTAATPAGVLRRFGVRQAQWDQHN